MKDVFRKFAMLSAVALLCAGASVAALACKSDYCNGSQAPTSLNQVGGTPDYQAPSTGGTSNCVPPSPPATTMVENLQNQSAAEQAIGQMSYASVYSMIQSIPDPEAQYEFYKSVVYYVGGNFQDYVRQQKFNDDHVAYNTWINTMDYGADGMGFSFDLTTGAISWTDLTTHQPVTYDVSNWVCQ